LRIAGNEPLGAFCSLIGQHFNANQK
jgi:hypothetical protein